MNGERDIYVRAKRPWNTIQEADAILREIDSLAKALGMTCFLWGGTALGFYRDGTYLRGDADIDLGLKCTDDQRKEFTETILKRGYKPLGASTKRYVKEYLWVDFYFSGDLRLAEQVIYCQSFSAIRYKGRLFNIPMRIEEYLAEVYGVAWKTKKTYFIERFQIPKAFDGRAYVAIGGKREELILLAKNTELVKLKRLDMEEDER